MCTATKLFCPHSTHQPPSKKMILIKELRKQKHLKKASNIKKYCLKKKALKKTIANLFVNNVFLKLNKTKSC